MLIGFAVLGVIGTMGMGIIAGKSHQPGDPNTPLSELEKQLRTASICPWRYSGQDDGCVLVHGERSDLDYKKTVAVLVRIHRSGASADEKREMVAALIAAG